MRKKKGKAKWRLIPQRSSCIWCSSWVKPTRGADGRRERNDELRLIRVGDLMLSGDDSCLRDAYFRDYYLSQFFWLFFLLRIICGLPVSRSRFKLSQADTLTFLGDISARGWKLTRKQWISVIHQFNWVIGACVGIPFHVMLGGKDIGNCSRPVAQLFTGLPPCFVAMVLYGIEQAIERERILFSGHILKFSNYIHDDGTHEATVPSMSWNVEGAPGFVLAMFQNDSAVTVTHCSQTQEAHVLSLMFLLFMMMLIILSKGYY